MFDYNEIMSARKRFTNYDKKILEGNRKFESLDDLERNVSTGRFSIDLKEWHFECLFHDKPGRNLYVIYSGARNHDPIPHFPRWSYYPLFDGGMLSIEDPMYYRYPELAWGVFYGNEETSILDISITIIKRICSAKGYERVVFFSSSAGGYASIYAACSLENAVSIAVNPQLYLQNWKAANHFKKITGIDLKIPDPLLRNNLVQKIKNSNSKHVLFMNYRDDLSWDKQFKPLYKEFQVQPKYGIVESEKVLFWLYDCVGVPHAHIAWETKSIFLIIERIANLFLKKVLLRAIMKYLYASVKLCGIYMHINMNLTRLKRQSMPLMKKI